MSFSEQLTALAAKHGVELHRDLENDCANNGWHTYGRVINLGPFDDPDLELVAFYHELGHLLLHAEALACAISLMRGWRGKLGLTSLSPMGSSGTTTASSRSTRETG